MIDFDKNNYAKNLTDAFLKGKDSNNYKILENERADIESHIKDLFDIYEILNLDMAYGETLDRYGERVGQPRGNASDPQYIIMIKAKIMRSLGNGTYPSVLKALAATFSCDIKDVYISESNTPCTVDNVKLPLTALNSGMTREQIKELAESLFPVTVILEKLDYEGTFEFGESEHDYDEMKGFADDIGSIGGYLGYLNDDETEPILPC